MPRKSNSRAAQGAGTIRKKTVTRNGQTYNYWEARITTGYDPGTGKQIQRSFSGKTQKEVREKMQAIAIELNNGTYKEPLKMTVGEWLDIWAKDYLNNVKPRTREIYKASIRNHIKPALGTIRLEALDTPTIQAFYNGLSSPCKTRDHNQYSYYQYCYIVLLTVLELSKAQFWDCHKHNSRIVPSKK